MKNTIFNISKALLLISSIAVFCFNRYEMADFVVIFLIIFACYYFSHRIIISGKPSWLCMAIVVCPALVLALDNNENFHFANRLLDHEINISIRLLWGIMCMPFSAYLYSIANGGIKTSLANKRTKTLEKLAQYGGIVISACSLSLLLWFAFSKNIWLDEAFSIALLRNDCSEMLSLASRDVHPPLYYLFVKGFSNALEFIGIHAHIRTFGKLFSIIPLIIISIMALTYVRKKWGNWTSGLFLSSVFGMSYFIYWGNDIRMYGLGALWIFIASLAFYQLLKHPSAKNISMFTIMGILGAYTHHFCLVAIGFLYLSWLTDILHSKKRKLLKVWFIAVTVSIICYIPQLIYTLEQVLRETHNDDYYLGPISFRTCVDYFNYIFDDFLALELLFIATVPMIFVFCKKKGVESTDRLFVVTMIALPFLVTGFGVLVSLLSRPIFTDRHMSCALPGMWLGFFILISYIKRTDLTIWTTVLVLAGASRTDAKYYEVERWFEQKHIEAEEFYTAHDDCTYIISNYFITEILAANHPDDVANFYLWEKQYNWHIKALFRLPSGLQVADTSQLTEMIKNHNEVIAIIAPEDHADMLHQIMSNPDIETEGIGNYRIKDGEYFYKLRLKNE